MYVYPHFFLLKNDSEQFIPVDNVSTINNPVADSRGGGDFYTILSFNDVEV